MARIIGLDLGAWSVKATIMEGGFSRFDVVDQYIETVPQDGEELPSFESRVAAAERLLQNLSVDESTLFGLGYPIDKASMRWVTMPFTDKNQIAQTLSFEVEGLVPFDLDEMVVEHRILGSTDDGSAVLAAIVPREGLGGHIQAVAEAGFDPKSLVIDGDLLSTHGEAGVEAIIDIGHSRTIVTVARDGETVFSRAISMGGWHLTQAVAKGNDVDWATAESLKHAARLDTATVSEWDDDQATQSTDSPAPIAPADVTTDALRAALLPLLASLRTTLIGFEDTSGHEVDRIRLTGGTSELDGLVNMLKDEMGVAVTTIALGTSDLSHSYAHALSALQVSAPQAGSSSGPATFVTGETWRTFASSLSHRLRWSCWVSSEQPRGSPSNTKTLRPSSHGSMLSSPRQWPPRAATPSYRWSLRPLMKRSRHCSSRLSRPAHALTSWVQSSRRRRRLSRH